MLVGFEQALVLVTNKEKKQYCSGTHVQKNSHNQAGERAEKQAMHHDV